MKFYKCDLCGNILEVIQDSAIVPVCCGQSMNILTANTDEKATKEKHVPVFTKKGNEVRVDVGILLHPSLEEHYIEWIILETNKGIYKRYLKPNDIPSITFSLQDDEDVINIYAYCNIHGLWAMNR